MNDVEKHFRRTLVEENRKRRKTNEVEKHFDSTIISDIEAQDLNICLNSLNILELNCSSDDGQTNLEYPLADLQLFVNQQTIQPIFDSNDNVETNCALISQQDLSEIEEFIRVNEFFQNSVDSYKPTLDFVSQNLPIPRPVTDYENNFTELEDYKLMELFEVLRPLDFNFGNVQCGFYEIGTVAQLVQMVNTFYEKEITSFVESIKRMNIFQNICENDRIALVKYSLMDILMLRSVQLYDTNQESWTIPFVRVFE